MEKKFAAFLISLFLFINILPFIAGFLKTPRDRVFLGTVHYPPDYHYYLSNITQSRDQLILIKYLNTTEPMPKLFVGWVYVLLGKVGNIFNAPPWITYQLGLLLFGLLYLVSAYLLINLLLPESAKSRILAFLLFMISNTLPRIVVENGNTIIAPYFSWYNYGEPFIRFDSVPHHQLINASIFIVLVSFIYYKKASHKIKILLLFASAMAGICLGSMQPVQWVLISGTLTLYLILFSRDLILNRIKSHLPLIIFILFGLPFVFYLQFVISNLKPYIIASKWEASQSYIFNWDQYLKYFGPVFILGIIGVPTFLYKKIFSRRIVAFITITSLAIFAAPFSKNLPVLNFRFLSPLIVLFFATSGTLLILKTSIIFRGLKPLFQSITIFILAALLTPLFYYHLQSRLGFSTDDQTVYIPRDTYTLLLKARNVSSINDLFLVYWPLETVFPALTGRSEFFTSELLTLDYERKSGEAYLFLVNRISDQEKIDWLKKNKISFIISHSTEKIAAYPFLKPIYSTPEITLFKVQLE